MRKNLTKSELRIVRLASIYTKKSADIIYKIGDGNLYANGVSEKAYAVARMLRAY